MTRYLLLLRIFRGKLGVDIFEMWDNPVLGKTTPTVAAFQQCQSSMGVKMFLLVRELVECEFATIHWTQKRAFKCVNAQMVEQIMPFSEEFLAFVVVFIADEHTKTPPCPFVGKLHLGECS